MAPPGPIDNAALVACLEAIKPEGLSFNAWVKRAGLGSSFLRNLRKGSEPGIYKIERLVRVAGYELSAFWKMVEQAKR